MIVAVWLVMGAEVVTVKVAVLEPARTVTDKGTEAYALLLERPTTTSPAGATTSSVTVPVAFAIPPTTLVGATETEERFAADA
ncbi:MAG TPA: hypothetical protein PLB01_05010 [Thermoanaerobaculia bacterium]|nr:hypothetical protein [Thermoanaerobaculia bacterium]